MLASHLDMDKNKYTCEMCVIFEEIKIIIRVCKVALKTKEIELLRKKNINVMILHNQNVELQQ